MHRLVARAMRTLVLAGVIAPGAALATEPLLAPPVRPAESRAAVPETARRAAMLVELELLADPLTFPCSLRVELQGGFLALHGSIPGKEVQERALSIARKTSSMPVADSMQIMASIGKSASAPLPPTFMSDVRARLEQASPEHGKMLGIKVSSTGEVSIAGHVRSLEERLQLSRCLMNMPGCTAVKNELVIADAKQAAEGKPPASTVTDRPVTWVPAGSAKPPAPSAAASPAQPIRQASAVERPSMPQDVAQAIGVLNGSQPQPVPETRAVEKPAPPPPKPIPEAPKILEPQPVVQAKFVEEAPKPPPTEPAKVETEATPLPVRPAPIMARPGLGQTLKSPYAASPAPAAQTSARPVQGHPVTIIQGNNPAQVVHAPASAPAPSSSAGVPASLVFHEEPAPLPATQQVAATGNAPVPPQPVVSKDVPSVSEVAAKMTEPGPTVPAAKPAQPAAPSAVAKQRLKQKVKATIGDAASDVDLAFDGKGGVKVTCRVKTDADVNRVTAQILKVAELTEYQIALEFKIDKAP